MKPTLVYPVVWLPVVKVLLVLVCETPSASASPLTFGNFLVSDEVVSGPGRLREFTSAGVLVQTLSFPSSGQPRDIAVNAHGNIAIYNGTFDPVLTVLNSVTGAVVSETPFPGWSTVNNTTYGGIAAFGNFVFVTDMTTAHDGAPNGIIRFDIHDRSRVRFATGQSGGSGDYIDLTAGQDGLLYALFPGGGPGGNAVDVYDPLTLAFQRRINLPESLLAISVDVNGDLFGATINDRNVYHFDRNGSLLRAVQTDMTGFVDANIDRHGRLMLSAGENVLLTDRNLSTFNIIHVNTITPYGAIFTAWVETTLTIPEPESLVVLAIGLFVLVARSGRVRLA